MVPASLAIVLPFNVAAFLWLRGLGSVRGPSRVLLATWNARAAVVTGFLLAAIAFLTWFGATAGQASDPSQNAKLILQHANPFPVAPIAIAAIGTILPLVCAWRLRHTPG